jgi:hypothetical protein
MSFGGLDLASGYARDLVRGQPWGQGAADYKTARDQYATTNPWGNLAGNVVGGFMAPLPYIGKAFEATKDIASPAARWAATTLLGAGTGATVGGVTSGVNELPAGTDQALQGAKHGAAWGAGLGAVLPGAAALGTRAGAPQLIGSGRSRRPGTRPQLAGRSSMPRPILMRCAMPGNSTARPI